MGALSWRGRCATFRRVKSIAFRGPSAPLRAACGPGVAGGLRRAAAFGAIASLLIAGAAVSRPAAADPLPAIDPAAAREALGLGPRERLSPERIQTFYREALGLWAGGQDAAAAERLMALEAVVVPEGDIEARQVLLKAQEQTIRALAASNLEVLVPMAMLHHELYRRHLEQGEARHALLTVHARNMARDLALLYERHAGTEHARITSARLLTSLGGYLLSASQQLLAGQLFNLAAGYDPGSMGPQLGLATIYEKNGRYEAAEQSLRKAVAADPMRVEAWLRLGVNLVRLGKTAEARRALEPLVGIPTWVGAVAVQELGRIHTAREEWAAAETILKAGRERFPNEGAIAIELCSVLDRQGKRGEAQRVLAEFMEVPPGARGTSRLRYNQDPAEVWAEARRQLDGTAGLAMPILAQALGQPLSVQTTGEASR